MEHAVADFAAVMAAIVVVAGAGLMASSASAAGSYRK